MPLLKNHKVYGEYENIANAIDYYKTHKVSQKNCCEKFGLDYSTFKYYYYVAKPKATNSVQHGGSRPNPTADTELHTSVPDYKHGHKKVKLTPDQANAIDPLYNAKFNSE
jgi:hypothetical protein